MASRDEALQVQDTLVKYKQAHRFRARAWGSIGIRRALQTDEQSPNPGYGVVMLLETDNKLERTRAQVERVLGRTGMQDLAEVDYTITGRVFALSETPVTSPASVEP